jgi:predicted Zn-dependent protease
MQAKPISSRQAAPKTYLFGSFAVHRDSEKQTSSLRVNARRFAAVSAITFLIAYGLAASAGYLWLHQVRKIDQVSFSQVALLRWKKIRQGIAAQQFTRAKEGLAAKEYQRAYVAFNSALRNDPDNVAGRLMFVAFLQAMGARDSAVKLLEDGLTRAPDNRELIQQTFDLLTTTEHDRDALALLHGSLAPQFTGPNGSLLRTFEILATLNTDGPAKAHALLDHYADLKKDRQSWPVVARVQWESQERLPAIDTLSAFIKAQPDSFAGYALLADYQAASGLIPDARQTADLACTNFPKEIAAHILRIGTLAPTRADEVRRWQQEIAGFLREFGNQPEAILMLGNLAGRRGWVPLARLMYEVSVSRQQNCRPLALYYSDALMCNKRFEEAQRVLAEVDQQTQNDPALLPLLWQRQVVVAAALGAHEDARETARRLATMLQRDPEQLEICRQRFLKLGIPEAVSELTVQPLIMKDKMPKKS